jgi:hypothetical protein
MAHRFCTPDEITDPAALSAVLGPVRTVEREPLAPSCFTAARFERLRVTLESGQQRSLVTKRFRPSLDWIAVRSGDACGRASMLLAEPRLAGIWDVFACPYLGYATGPDDMALLMDDLTPHLFPDVREPIDEQDEELLLRALARLHARFWGSPVLELPWLAGPEAHAGLIDACCAAEPRLYSVLADPVRENITRGWAAALRRLPASLDELIRVPACELAWVWSDLPRTLLHGDAKVGNMARLPDGRVAAFDWALVAAGPPTLDLGWYLAVNATRLARSKEHVLQRYRTLVDEARGETLSDACWHRLVQAGVVIGARMLLWSKALALEADRPGAGAEWAWWIERLEAIAA